MGCWEDSKKLVQPMGLKKETGSFDSGGIKMYQYGHMAKEETNIREVPSPSRFILNTRMAPWWPIRCSVMQTTCSSSSLKETRFTAVGNSHR